MIGNILNAMPKIPNMVMRDMQLITYTEGRYDNENGGQWVKGLKVVERFPGVLLPLSEMDLQRMPQGEYTSNQQKVYTNGFELPTGAEIVAPDGLSYIVKRELEYGSIHPMRRFLVERKGVVSDRI